MQAELFDEMKVAAEQISALLGWSWDADKTYLITVTMVQW
jgi:hypothetical protein